MSGRVPRPGQCGAPARLAGQGGQSRSSDRPQGGPTGPRRAPEIPGRSGPGWPVDRSGAGLAVPFLVPLPFES
jgi:hypothetical protein